MDLSWHPSEQDFKPRAFPESDSLRALRKLSLRRQDPVSMLAFHYLLLQCDALLKEEPRARLGVELEGVHQMRVAIRRIRALLRMFRKTSILSKFSALQSDLKWVADRLGAVRDLDVYLATLKEYEAELEADDGSALRRYEIFLNGQRVDASSELLSCLDSDRYLQLLASFASALQECSVQNCSKADDDRTSIARAAKVWIRKQYHRVVRDGRSIGPDSPDERLHELRIECKRLRYLLEFFRPCYGASFKPTIKRLRALQDILGLVQDAHVATMQLRGYAGALTMAPEHKSDLLMIGQLLYMQRRQTLDNRGKFLMLWPEFDQKGARKEFLKHL
jgi:CHAD domain-containing protein